MKASLYAVRLEQGWELGVSLDCRVDLWWWVKGKEKCKVDSQRGDFKGRVAGEKASPRVIVLLSGSMPLGWAVLLRDGFRSSSEMDHWEPRDWMSYIASNLKFFLEGERDPGNSSRLETPCLLWTNEEQGSPQADREQAMDAAMNWEELQLEAARIADALEGRSLLEAELQQLLAERLPELSRGWRSAVQLAHLQGRVQLTSGVALADARPARGCRLGRRARRVLRCRRCGSGVHRRTPCGSCGCSGCAYCEACLALGRSRSCALLLRGSSAIAVPPPAPAGVGGTAGPPTASQLDRWGLSPAQREAAGAALQFLAQPLPKAAAPEARTAPVVPQRGWARLLPRRAAPQAAPAPASPLATRPAVMLAFGSAPPVRWPPRFLLWAVTGAGKTEMIFPLLGYVLDRGGKVLVATPRRDVVLELAPRLAKAFPNEKMAVLYGGSPQRWEEGRLFLSTTHQLLRFSHAFDLVVIDELDAFPYHNDPMLAYAAENSCKAEGRFIYLSATPPANLQREVRAGRLPHAKVPARFHGHPLPVPRRIHMESVEACLRRQIFRKELISSLETSIRRGAQVFVFVSRIRHIEPVVALLRSHFPSLPIEGTSSQDKSRSDHVLDFRAANTRLLVTTTILERGVTVPKSDVYILDADSELFDEASLVQMAGRAGRSKEDPRGTVVFVSKEWTKSQRSAVRQIRSMNVIAGKNGFLKEKKEAVSG